MHSVTVSITANTNSYKKHMDNSTKSGLSWKEANRQFSKMGTNINNYASLLVASVMPFDQSPRFACSSTELLAYSSQKNTIVPTKHAMLPYISTYVPREATHLTITTLGCIRLGLKGNR